MNKFKLTQMLLKINSVFKIGSNQNFNQYYLLMMTLSDPIFTLKKTFQDLKWEQREGLSAAITTFQCLYIFIFTPTML